MAIQPVSQAATDIIKATQAVAPLIQESRSAMEEERRLPPKVVDALRELGAFRLAVPRAYGGLELDPVTQVRVVEELSRMDGSVGWCAMISSAGSFAANGPVAVRKTKETVLRSLSVSFAEGFRIERENADFTMRTEDAKEGPRAFMEKRPPRYLGR